MHAVLENVVHQIAREIGGMDADTAQKHPQGSAHLWSSQQVIEHLVLGCRSSARKLEERLAKGRVVRKQKRSLLQWVLQLMILSFGHIPQGAPPMDDTLPVPGSLPAMDGGQLVSLLRNELRALDEVLERCRRKFGMERVAVHPILGPLRVDQWRRFHVVHALHAMKQIERVRLETAPQPIENRAFNMELTKEFEIPAQRSLT